MSAPHDRAAAEPGGMECMECGVIFVGAEWHTCCAVCAEKPRPMNEPIAGNPMVDDEQKPVAYMDENGAVSVPEGSPLVALIRGMPEAPVGRSLLPLYASPILIARISRPSITADAVPADVYPKLTIVRGHKHTCANVQIGSSYEDKCDCGALDTAGNAIPVCAPAAPAQEGALDLGLLLAAIRNVEHVAGQETQISEALQAMHDRLAALRPAETGEPK